MELSGRTALVTGGCRGIGRAISQTLAEAGAAVAVVYRRDARAAAETVEEIRAAGGRAEAFATSIDALDELPALISAVTASLGPVDALVCNAGQASRGAAVADTEPGEVGRLLATHALAAHRLAQLTIPSMRAAARGDVIVISSSEVAQMRAGGAPYNMAKAAAEALALTLAKEEARNGIRVNVVAPGLVATDMGERLVRAKLGPGAAVAELDAAQPFGRVTRPRDVAAAVRFLLSPAAAQITGQRIVVDGGSDAFPAAGAAT